MKRKNSDIISPAQDFFSLKNDIDSLFDAFWGRPSLNTQTGINAGISVDLSEKDNQIIARANIPGLNPDDINLEIHEGSLSISGEYKNETETDEENFYRLERSYGSFSRTIPLPAKVNAESVVAKTKNGVLTISMEKAESATKKKIPISSDE